MKPIANDLTENATAIEFLQKLCSEIRCMGILPHVDISLPFISYSGSTYICNMVLVGMLASIYRRLIIICVV